MEKCEIHNIPLVSPASMNLCQQAVDYMMDLVKQGDITMLGCDMCTIVWLCQECYEIGTKQHDCVQNDGFFTSKG